MANVLTGDYEAALQIAIRQINGLLGTLHQNGAIKDAALQLPHSTTGRIGDPHRGPPVVDVNVFEDWVLEFQRAGPSRGVRDIQTQLIAAAPPGAARMLTDAFAALRTNLGNVPPPPPPEVVRGLVRLQSASATITVPQGSSSEITVHAGIRAQYYPDTGTSDLPAPIHGDVHAGFDVRRAQTGSGTRLVISPSSQDAKIQFTAAPGSGLDAFEENVLAIQVRKVLRELMVFLPVDLPANFPFTVFKGLGSGASQAIALPFQLSDPPPPPPASGVQPLTQSFVDSSGFAVAVSKDFVIGLIDTAQIQQIVTDTHLPLDYHLQFTSGPSLTFKTGAIEISGRLDGVPPSRFLPSPFISFTQSVTLVLNTSTQTARLVRVGDPTVDPARSPLQVPRSPALIRSSVVSPRSTSATLTKLRA